MTTLRERYKEIISATVALSILLSLIFVSPPEKAYGATYTFTQNSWAGGSSASTAVHPANQTGWTNFSTSTNINATTSVQLATSTGSFTENFTGTTYEDATNTTATWDTSAPQRLVS